MKKRLVIFFLMAINFDIVLAEGCDINFQSRTVSCLSDETYSSTKHGLPLATIVKTDDPYLNDDHIIDGWNYINETIERDDYALRLYSEQWLMDSLDLTTSGYAADALIIRSWRPSMQVNRFTANTTGGSADGINVARESQIGEVVIYEDLHVSSQLGIGLRVNIGAFGYTSANSITSWGPAYIETFGSGDFNEGHSVMAGTTRGCGPGGAPLFECRVFEESTATINLLGNTNTIRTHGSDSAGIYSRAKGFIRVRNADIASIGDRSFGIFANRLTGNWYYDRNTRGPYDYSGEVELLGNVKIVSNGSNSFAFYVDSHSGNGEDQLGVIANIRSIDDESDQETGDGIYDITGDMYAKNSGIIDLSMKNRSHFKGSSFIENSGVIDIDINGPNSSWNMTGDSTLTSLYFEGLVKFPMQLAYNTLTVTSNYNADNGTLSFSTCLGDSASLSDQLIVEGDTQGTTYLNIRPKAGDNCSGALTDNGGILLVQVSGDSSGTFELKPSSIRRGNFVYRLEKQENNWYLFSTQSTEASITPVPVDSHFTMAAMSGLLIALGFLQFGKARRSERPSATAQNVNAKVR